MTTAHIDYCKCPLGKARYFYCYCVVCSKRMAWPGQHDGGLVSDEKTNDDILATFRRKVADAKKELVKANDYPEMANLFICVEGLLRDGCPPWKIMDTLDKIIEHHADTHPDTLAGSPDYGYEFLRERNAATAIYARLTT